jgi:plasmid stabilization system protein ParE
MPRRVVYSRRAQNWIDAETEYLLVRSPRAARRFLDRLTRMERLLAEHPQAGRRHPVVGVRQLVVAPYVLRYREIGTDIAIVDIRHGRQQERPIPGEVE